MIGIYKIENNLNHHLYIGSSTQIEKRWATHKRVYKYEGDKEYNKTLYKAFRKYGINNFSFSVIEECPIEELNEREKYWINYYRAMYDGNYNETPGGELGSKKGTRIVGEDNPHAVLKEEDVIEIIKLLETTQLSYMEIHNKYPQVSESAIQNINRCKCWSFLHQYKKNIREEAQNIHKYPSPEEIKNIIYLLETTDYNICEIARLTHRNRKLVTNINNCMRYTEYHNYKNNIRLESKGSK